MGIYALGLKCMRDINVFIFWEWGFNVNIYFIFVRLFSE